MDNHLNALLPSTTLLLILIITATAGVALFSGSAVAQPDAQRTIDQTQVTNGSTVTVTVNSAFGKQTDNAKIVDNINGGLSDENISITSADPPAFSIVTSDPAVDVTYSDALNFPLGSNSSTVDYEVSIPENAPVGTTYTFDGTITNDDTGKSSTIVGESQVTVVNTKITGQVFDTSNQSLSGVDVKIYNQSDLETPIDKTKAGKSGNYSFGSVDKGSNYRIVASLTDETGTTSTGFTTVPNINSGITNADVIIDKNKNGNIDVERNINQTEVSNGSIVTVTINATFDKQINNAKLVDNINGELSDENVSIDAVNPSAFSVITNNPTVDVTYNDGLNFPLNSDSFTVKYEVSIPEDTPVGTIYTFDGIVTNDSSGKATTIGGDTQLRIVATQSNVTVGDEKIPREYTSKNDDGEPTVTPTNAVSAINDLRSGELTPEETVRVINALRASS